HLPLVRAAIAGKKLVPGSRLDDAHGRVGPGEAVIGIGDRWLSAAAGCKTLRRRCHHNRCSHGRLADWSSSLRSADSRRQLEEDGQQTNGNGAKGEKNGRASI